MRVKPSIIFAIWFVREIGLTSFSTDLGGICLGRGDTIACFREGYTTPSHKEVLYISAIKVARLDFLGLIPPKFKP